MTLRDIHKAFPTESACLAHLEVVRWGGKPVCPYCASSSVSTIQSEHRFHCNTCNTSFSVRTRTVFHGSKIDARKLLLVSIAYVANGNDLSVRELSRLTGINKNTAHSIILKFKNLTPEQQRFLLEVSKHD